MSAPATEEPSAEKRALRALWHDCAQADLPGIDYPRIVLALLRDLERAEAKPQWSNEALGEIWSSGYASGFTVATRRLTDDPEFATTPNPYTDDQEAQS